MLIICSLASELLYFTPICAESICHHGEVSIVVPVYRILIFSKGQLSANVETAILSEYLFFLTGQSLLTPGIQLISTELSGNFSQAAHVLPPAKSQWSCFIFFTLGLSSVHVCFCLVGFWVVLAVPSDLWDLSSWTRNQTHAREFPRIADSLLLLQVFFLWGYSSQVPKQIW